MGNDNATFGQEQLDIPQAEAEHMVQPDSVADDHRREAMAVVGRGEVSYRHCCQISLPDPVTATMPANRLGA